jgi:hypothetical protein
VARGGLLGSGDCVRSVHIAVGAAIPQQRGDECCPTAVLGCDVVGLHPVRMAVSDSCTAYPALKGAA